MCGITGWVDCAQDLEQQRPVLAEMGTRWPVNSGEVYNYRELRAELTARGYRFRTQSDTAVILCAYLQRGEDFVDRLNGMYAFARYRTPTPPTPENGGRGKWFTCT